MGLLAALTVAAVGLMAVAPSIVQEIQRQRELESIRRGEEVADAIRQYVLFHNGTKLPNNIDDLLEGLPQGTKKRMILRPSAAIDPLSEDGKWLLVKDNGNTLKNFARRVQNYNGGALPGNPNPVNMFDRFVVSSLVNVLDTKSVDDITAPASETDQGDDLTTDNTPFIGVVSNSKARSVIAYYGIENHSKWVFTPLFRGGGVLAGGGRKPDTENKTDSEDR